MAQEKDTGIILSRKDSLSADNICSIYTRKSGKGWFVFRGLKKSGRRPRSGAEPGTVLDIIYYSGRDDGLNTISDFDILTSNRYIRENTEKIFSMFYILELVSLTTGHADPNMKIFNLLMSGIETLSHVTHVTHFNVFFTVRYLLLQGIFPDTGQCSWCGEERNNKLLIEIPGFRTSCRGCIDPSASVISAVNFEFINQCIKVKLDKIDCSRYTDGDVHILLVKLIDYIQNYFIIKLKSGSMLGSI